MTPLLFNMKLPSIGNHYSLPPQDSVQVSLSMGFKKYEKKWIEKVSGM